MQKLHLFNPENDIALASGLQQFTPPKAALALRNAGAALPLWYADNGDRLLAYGINTRWFDMVCERFGIDVDIFDHQSAAEYAPAPWGWSAAARRDFAAEGFQPSQLPDDRLLEHYRQLSHRRTAAELRQAIAPRLDFEIAQAAVEFSDITMLTAYLHQHPCCIIKSPWSSSGRGLTDTRRMKTDEVLRRCEGVIRRQGSVMVEPAYDRIADFACLFTCENGKCDFVGYSFFKTDDGGNYCGNLLAGDDVLLDEINRYFPKDKLTAVVSALQCAIESLIAPCYTGPLGVDMLVARMPDGQALLDATVELNLRMTMGFVAHSLSQRFLAPGVTATYSVSPAQKTPVSDYVVVENRRIVDGRMMLTPPGGQFSFILETAAPPVNS